jgi:hypothetical protein
MKVCCGATATDEAPLQLSAQRLGSYYRERYRDVNHASYDLYTRHDLGQGCHAALFEHDIAIVECAENCSQSAEPQALADELADRAGSAAEHAYGTGLRTLWTSRWLEIHETERAARADHIRAWLARSIHPDDADDIIKGRLDVSMTWLNYVLIEGDRAEERRDAMRLAQYYYAAVDQINLGLLDLIRRLSPDSTDKGDVDEHATRRSQLEMQAMMQNVHLQEDLRAISRQQKDSVERILEVWEFEPLKAVTRDLLKVCGDLIDAKVAQKARSSGLITEVILVAIGAVAVLDVALSLAFSSRGMATDPRLLVNEPGLPWTARWFSSTSLDSIMFGALGCIVLLVGLYGLFKRRHR